MEYIIIGLIVLAVISYFSKKTVATRKEVGPGDSFVCSSCGALAKHDNRTLNALRRSGRSIICRSCHASWLEQQRAAARKAQRARALGCVFFLILIVLAFVFFQ